MKSLYYRSQKISSRSLAALALVALATIVVVEICQNENSESQCDLMTAAAYQAEAAFDAVHCRRVEMGHIMLRSQDPAGTGMLGPSMSLVTTLPGHLDAKQTSANPNFAAVAVHYLLAAGAKPGDRVAIGCTGSFPALNIAVLSAAESMGLKPTLISSAASSQFGANHPDLMWPDIEQSLSDDGIISTRSAAVSRGGFRDMASGMTDETRLRLDGALQRSGRPTMQCDSLDDAIDRRMELFSQSAGDINRYVAYINVGGGSASVGGTKGNDQLGRGLIRPKDHQRIEDPIDCVAARFLGGGVPVVNMINVISMANEHGLTVAPVVRPTVGQGDVYQSRRYRKPLALAGILFILAATGLIVRPPVWVTQRLAQIGWIRPSAAEAKWMV